MKTLLKLKSILFVLTAVLAVAVVMTSCEQESIENLTQEVVSDNSQINLEEGQTCSDCMQYSHEKPDEIVDVLIKYSKDGEPVIEKAARYGEVIVYGGDVILTEDYSNEVSLRGNITSDFSRVWPNSTLPYVWGSGLSTAQKNLILNAIQDINEQTNLCVVERTNEAAYIQIRSAGSGCYAIGIGNTGAANQVINLGNGCFSNHTIIHEILHKAGFFHEQTHPDRDDFITVNWSNLDGPSWTYQFTQQGSETAAGPYDFASIMHYRQFASVATIDNTQPMYFIDNPNALPAGMTASQIGTLPDMSAGDIAAVNTLYSGCNSCNSAPDVSDLGEFLCCGFMYGLCQGYDGDQKHFQLVNVSTGATQNGYGTSYYALFPNLASGAAYKLRVRRKCGTSGSYGPWSAYKNFTTLSCLMTESDNDGFRLDEVLELSENF